VVHDETGSPATTVAAAMAGSTNGKLSRPQTGKLSRLQTGEHGGAAATA